MTEPGRCSASSPLAAPHHRAVLALAVAATLALFAAPAGAQTAAGQIAQVASSTGTAEAFIPDVGWRQAVLGRVLPVGSTLTCWIDSSAEVEAGEATFILSGLSHAELTSVSSERVELILSAGSLKVMTAGTEVLIRVRGTAGSTAEESTIVILVNGEAHVTSTEVVLTSGSARVDAPREETVELVAGDQFSLAVPPLEPVFR
jgi:uncharacterized cupin superfamily protein